MDPGQDPTAGHFSGLIVVGTVNIWCTVVQRWLLATNRDCIAVGLSFESPALKKYEKFS